MKNKILVFFVLMFFFNGCLDNTTEPLDNDTINDSGQSEEQDNQEEQEEEAEESEEEPEGESEEEIEDQENEEEQEELIGCTHDNPSCLENQICQENVCYDNCDSDEDCACGLNCFNDVCTSVECEEDLDCEDPSLECNNYSCEKIGICLYNSHCNADEVCISKSCNKVTNCLSGECEDDYFELSSITLEEFGEQLLVRATISAKTDKKGSFRLLWNEAGSKGFMKSVEMEYEEDDNVLLLWIYLNPTDFPIEHYLIEHVENPKLFYLIEQYDFNPDE